ncbi:MAG: hypothetical protein K2K81_06420 [Muribaculaceae bacterium]|nr:hypothetical protein [Muribaculaceae bacterium]
MELNKDFFEKIFSSERMAKYFDKYPTDPARAMLHYKCNLELSESMYVSLSVLEVALRNAISRELRKMTGRDDWYAIFPTTPGLRPLNKYITLATHHISGRHETVTPSKIIAELTLGFWVSLLNSEYERVLWKDLRKAFPYMPKNIRQRKNVSAPLNRFRNFRNRIFHNEAICWNINHVRAIHTELIQILGWINKDLPLWIAQSDRFPEVCNEINKSLGLS